MVNKRTKIVATLGPASETITIIRALVEHGANVFRLNFSHGSYENHAMLVENIRAVSKELSEPIAILQDLQGPKIRLGKMPEGGIEITDGQTVVFDTGLTEYTSERVPVDFADLHRYLKPGDRLLINDGRVETSVIAVEGTIITVMVTHGGLLESHKGLNVPDSHITVSSLTDKDRRDAEFGVAHGVDYMALSFVKTAADIRELRALIPASIKIIAKIERPEALANIHEILGAADGIMVARGDLGIEIPDVQVPVTQKNLIAAALAAAKPVIVATQMLDSMQNSPRPTRAEVSDVANAVIDHTDAVMLSNESATGLFPVETVTEMANIIVATEASKYDDIPYVEHRGLVDVANARSGLLSLLSATTQAGAIITVVADLASAALISRHRPQMPILAAVPSESIARQLALLSGMRPFVFTGTSPEECIEAGVAFGIARGMIKSGEKVVVVLSDPYVVEVGTAMNFFEIKTVV